MPSSTRCFARSRTESGTSSRVVSATHVASRPVGPEGSVGGLDVLARCLTVLDAWVVEAMGFSFSELRRFHGPRACRPSTWSLPLPDGEVPVLAGRLPHGSSETIDEPACRAPPTQTAGVRARQTHRTPQGLCARC